MVNRRKRGEEKTTKKIKTLERKLKRHRRVISSDEDDSGNEVQVLCSLINTSVLPFGFPESSSDQLRGGKLGYA